MRSEINKQKQTTHMFLMNTIYKEQILSAHLVYTQVVDNKNNYIPKPWVSEIAVGIYARHIKITNMTLNLKVNIKCC